MKNNKIIYRAILKRFDLCIVDDLRIDGLNHSRQNRVVEFKTNAGPECLQLCQIIHLPGQSFKFGPFKVEMF